ncbi:hypothetical protein pmac_cds_63 [Pandoravirus macleodensis]|uniref:Uncharacterized protein n=1 Tax=Pandoravirus macleodensis TaxID=2107707 RepID=A0A2U7UE57_9VIRU|nr:hypothetical protein pmac_cds_63 [Pandoravirus macleodensis]AVK76751.1 hypothetical protein pmac_cds_63 [Pandoravirus macleodensis]
MEHESLFTTTKPAADIREARRIVIDFINDPTAEDRYNKGVLDRLVGPLFASPRAAPAECSFHPNPSEVCYERSGFDRPWCAVRCSRSHHDLPVTMTTVAPTFGSTSNLDDTVSTPCQSKTDLGVQIGGPQTNPTPFAAANAQDKSGWNSFCETTCRSMRHPNFRLLWRHGSSRKGTLLQGVDVDAPLVVANDTFVMTVHRACIDALPDAVADPSFAATLFDVAREIGARLDRMHTVEPCAAAPCADARRWSTSRLASESDVVLAFCDALNAWHQRRSWNWSDMDDRETRALSRVSWVSDAVSAQEAIDLFRAYEETECHHRARVLLAPRLGGPFVVVSCGQEIFARDGNRYPDGTEAILKRHRVDSRWARTWVDETHVERALVDVIRAGGSALAETSVSFGGLQGGNAWAVVQAGKIVSSPLALATWTTVYAWSIGPSLLATEMALCALETVLAERPEYAAHIPDQVAALAVARRAMDALYADRQVRTTVLHKATVDRADTLWTRRGST